MALIRAAKALAVCALLVGTATAVAGPSDATLRELQIDSQPLADALSRLAQVSGLQIVFYSEIAADLRSPPLIGAFTVRAALERLLSGTQLEYEFIGERTIVVRAKRPQALPPPTQSSDGRARQTQEPAHDSHPRASRTAARDTELQTITVTARRRVEDLQHTPVAITALNAVDLELRLARSTDALANFVPNLQFDGAAPLSGAAYNATVFIRGTGQNDFAIFSEPGVAIYQDGVYLGRSIGEVREVLDTERIEVLRGPQGTLFGRNASGGAINIVSHAPEKEFGGDVALTVGELERRELRATLNLPLSEHFAARISAATFQRDGTGTRLTDGTAIGDKDSAAARAQLLWQPSEQLQAKLALDSTRVRQHSAALTLIGVAEDAPLLNLYNALVAPNLDITAPSGEHAVDASWITGDIDTTYASSANESNLDSSGAALTLDWHSLGVNWNSITAWRQVDAYFVRDGDNTPFTYRETANDDRQDQFSQELQVSGISDAGRFEWLSGAYFFREHATERGAATLARGLYAALAALPLAPGETWCSLSGPNPRPAAQCPPSQSYGGDAYRENNVLVDFDLDLNTRIANRSIALFGHSTYHFTEALAVTGGLRWTRDHKTIELVHRRLGSGEYIVGAPGTQREFSHSWSQVTPELEIEWHNSSDDLLYLSLAKGYKSGGFNGRPLVDSREVSEFYDPEIVDSYELGAKTRWREGRITANAALFYNDYRDMQLAINATPQNYVRNAGAARIRGAELEVVARVAADLDLNIATGFLDAQYTRLDPELEALRPALTRDKHLIKAPDWTVNVGMEYRLVRKFGSFVLRGDYIYRGKIYHDVFNDPRLTQRGSSLYNAYIGFAPPGQRWDVAVFGTNLGNTRYRISGNSSASLGLAESSFSPPRELGVTLRVRI